MRMPHCTELTPVRAFNLCDVATFRDKFDVVLILMKPTTPAGPVNSSNPSSPTTE